MTMTAHSDVAIPRYDGTISAIREAIALVDGFDTDGQAA